VRNRPFRTQRGVSLVESLVAFAVAALGMTALVITEAGLRHNAQLSRQRAEALRLAHQQMEQLRGFASWAEFEQLPAGPATSVHGGSSTRFTLERRFDGSAPATLATGLTVRWSDRTGKPASVGLASVIAGLDPALSGALFIRHPAPAAQGPGGRSPAIPPEASDLGDGRSAFAPPGAAGITWIFDNRSGSVTSVCSAPAGSGQAPPDRCLATNGRLVSGHVRFATDETPSAQDPEHPASPALDLDMVLHTGDGNATCFDDASPRSRRTSVAFHCLVTLQADKSAWSGRLDVQPVGWTLSHDASGFRVCRYSADQDGNGIGNHEHPLHYRHVATPLKHQNFLVVRGSQPCPASDSPSERRFVQRNTVEHAPQPQETPGG